MISVQDRFQRETTMFEPLKDFTLKVSLFHTTVCKSKLSDSLLQVNGVAQLTAA